MPVAYVDNTLQSSKVACSFDSLFDDACRQLRESELPQDRIAAVQTLAEFRGDVSTASLVAALFDDDARVRVAAIEALNQIGDPAISSECLEVLFSTKVHPAELTGRSEESVVEPAEPANVSPEEALAQIATDFDNSSGAVRIGAVFAIRNLEPDYPTSLFERLIESSTQDRRRKITDALAESGLAAEAIDSLGDGDRSRVQAALSFLFLMARLQVVQPLTHAIEHHSSAQIRRALIKVLTVNGQAELAESAAKRRLGIAPTTPDIYACR
jgi:HEAT repeat protein